MIKRRNGEDIRRGWTRRGFGLVAATAAAGVTFFKTSVYRSGSDIGVKIADHWEEVKDPKRKSK